VKRAQWLAALAAACLGCAGARAREPEASGDYPQPPEALFGDLFVAVQTGGIFTDGKTFVDAVPDAPPAAILADYHTAHPQSPEQLRSFVEQHFALPAASVTALEPAAHVSLVTHIDRLWEQLTRSTTSAAPYSSLLPLPAPYVVPGGRFREIYYWDSYFTMLGLKQSGRHDLVADMTHDFAYLIDTYGHVPNGTRTYYLSRSQPPFFFEMVAVAGKGEAADSFAHYLPQLKREYAFWMEGAEALAPGTAHRRVVAMPDGTILNRYWDDRATPRDESYRDDTELARASGREASQLFRDIRAAAESGWDFSSRWFADGHTRATIDTTEIVPVDLNSLLFGLENAIRAGCARQADRACAAEFRSRAAARRRAIDRYLWDGPAGAYLDYRWTQHSRVPAISAATLYPLFVGAASVGQARGVAASVRRTLLEDGGVVTTSVRTGEQWDAPNGWAPLQWIGVMGLRQYGERQLAGTIACRWLRSVRRVYAESGKLVEKYDVIDTHRAGGGGEYPLQDGFGWTNGVTRRLLAMYPADAEADQCASPAADAAFPSGAPCTGTTRWAWKRKRADFAPLTGGARSPTLTAPGCAERGEGHVACGRRCADLRADCGRC
jgi:alpha,alpha-trehalase